MTTSRTFRPRNRKRHLETIPDTMRSGGVSGRLEGRSGPTAGLLLPEKGPDTC